ncbi:MAG: hypothetical protein HKM87_08190 [Ignavibacteriaceae bacterium]|nr:hypothetical protein [Ignavibacteriaceae bacterium]
MKYNMLVVIVLSAFLFTCDRNENVLEPSNNVQVQVGCWSPSYVGYANSQIGCGLLQSFGDANLDQQFNGEVGIQRSFWQGVNASVFIFDECGDKNALSFPQGYILVGINLFFDVIYSTGSTLPNATVLAHEWVHQVQFRYGWMNNNEPTVRRTELEADAFSGYYTLLIKSWAIEQFNTVFATLYNLGDYNYNNRGHHCTPQERVNAGYLGMNTAIFALQNGISYSYLDLHQIFGNQLAKKEGESTSTQLQYQDVIDYLEKIGDRIDEEGFHKVENLRGQDNFIASTIKE